MGRISLRLAAWVLLGERIDAERAEAVVTEPAGGRGVGRRPSRARHRVHSGRGRHAGPGDAPQSGGAQRVRRRGHRPGSERARRRRRTGRAAERARPSGQALRPEALRGHVLGLLLAGNETTTAALLWMLVHGARQPDEWTKVATASGATRGAFVTESLRLTPAVWGIPRTPIKPGVTLTSGGATTRVRRGQLATVYLRAINRDPNAVARPVAVRSGASRGRDQGAEARVDPVRARSARLHRPAPRAGRAARGAARARAARRRRDRRTGRGRRELRAACSRRSRGSIHVGEPVGAADSVVT